MKDGPIIIGIDPARQGSDFTVLMRPLGNGAFEVLRLPPAFVGPAECTAAEILVRMAEADRALAKHSGQFANWRKLLSRPLMPPRRRKWDQYGAYHRRQMKKWMKDPFRRLYKSI